MILYHGSNIEIHEINLEKCMPFKDFGRGFYTTILPDQAYRMAQRRAKIAGGTPTITIYELPDDTINNSDLNCRIFDDKPTIEWALFIRNNRDRQFKGISSSECNLDAKYDIVVGPVADDTVGLLLRQFSRGTIDADYLKREFDFGTLTNQYTFHTEKAIKHLKKVGVSYVNPATGND